MAAVKEIKSENLAKELVSAMGQPVKSVDILIIDDDKWIHRVVGNHLKRWGFNPISAYDPVDGITQAVNKKPLLIIIDIILPMFNGDVLLRILKNIEPTSKIPTLIMSGNISIEVFKKTLRDGALAFISKPISQEILLDKIKESLGITVTFDSKPGETFFSSEQTPDEKK